MKRTLFLTGMFLIFRNVSKDTLGRLEAFLLMSLVVGAYLKSLEMRAVNWLLHPDPAEKMASSPLLAEAGMWVSSSGISFLTRRREGGGVV